MEGTSWAERQWWLLGALATVSSALAVSLFPKVTLDAGTILSTLATIQAAIFAIVFSVIVLGVQLSASRYSARLAATFTSGRDYQRTVAVFGTSIGFCVFGLYFTPSVSDLLTVHVIISGYLTVGAFLTLYQFVDSILEKTTPEGVITLISERLDPETIEREAKQAAEDATEPDPFLTMVSTINSLVSDKDRSAAILGQRMMDARISDLFDEADTDRFEEETPLDDSLKNLLVDQLPSIAVESLDHDLKQVATEVPETAKSIGSNAIDNELNNPLRHVVQGQTDLIDELKFEPPEESIRKDAADAVEDLLGQAIEKGLFEEAAIGIRRLGWVSAASAMMRNSDQHSRMYTSLLISTFPDLLSNALDSAEEICDLRVQQWPRVHMLDVSPEQKVIGSCYGSMAEVTSAAIRFELKTEQQFVNWRMVASGWTKGVERLEESDLRSIAELWFGTILYLRYLADVSPEYVMADFEPTTRYRIASDLPVETADKIIDGKLDPTSVIDHIPGRLDPVEYPLTGVKSPPIESDTSFIEWVEGERHLLDTSRRSGMYGHVDSLGENQDDEE